MNRNTIYLRRCRKVVLEPGSRDLSRAHVVTLLKNIESLGFGFTKPLIDRICTLAEDSLRSFYKSLTKDLSKLVGAHRPFRPMYPNFPEQVMSASEAELYWNAIVHYLTHRLPQFDEKPRTRLETYPELTFIDLGTVEDFEQIFTRLTAARTSLSPEDKEDLLWFIAQYRDNIPRLFPVEIPIKENLAVLASAVMRMTTLADSLISPRIQTATDVLRVAVALNAGDVSLAEPTKFTKLSRGQRKQLLAWLERTDNIAEDMFRWKERWKRLGEVLHPGEYIDRFPKTYAAFDSLRNDKPISRFNSQIERLVSKGAPSEAADLLAKRPGELVRRLDHLLRISDDPASILAKLRSVADRVATPVLLQTLCHFRRRNEPASLRSFFPKGEVGKVYARENQIPELPDEVCQETVQCLEETLQKRFSKLPTLGSCYLDPRLKNYLVPFSQRSASKALRTIVRGSRAPFPEANVIRLFLWWKNGKYRTDIDVSAALYRDDFKYVDVVSYYNLKSIGGCHSGDIVDAPQGAAEFIDLNIESTRMNHVRYVVMSINSYTEQPFCDLPECFAGFMGRSDANSGEIFEPRTVANKFDISSNTRICLPLILDLEAREVVWTDIALRKHPLWNNVHTNLAGVSLMLRSMTSLRKPDLHSLFLLHIEARGSLVSSPMDADSVFGIDEGITPFDLDRIAAEFM